jgi:hypothetical protein
MGDQQLANDMKTNYFKLDRLIPWLGIAILVGGVIASATYLNSERNALSSEASAATLERLIHDQHLSAALKKIHDGQVAEAAERLDLLLCGDILLINAELPSADPETRALVQKAFKRIASQRPMIEGMDSTSTQEHVADQVAAERILTLALAGPSVAEVK